MLKPVVRLKLDTTENINGAVNKPTIKFFGKKDGPTGMQITFGFEAIGPFVENPEKRTGDPVLDELIQRNFRDAIIDKEFFKNRAVSISFAKNGDSATMLLKTDLDTKLPFTGGRKLRNSKPVVEKSGAPKTKNKR